MKSLVEEDHLQATIPDRRKGSRTSDHRYSRRCPWLELFVECRPIVHSLQMKDARRFIVVNDAFERSMGVFLSSFLSFFSLSLAFFSSPFSDVFYLTKERK